MSTDPTTPNPEVTITTDPAGLSKFMARMTSKLSDGGKAKGIRRRTATLTINPDICEPDAFDAPFDIGIEGLTSQQELEALKKATDGASAGYMMAQASMRTFNGVRMKRVEADLVWDALGFAGRALVVNAYLNNCTGAGDGADLGKSVTTEVG